jgi:hypothetical protein
MIRDIKSFGIDPQQRLAFIDVDHNNDRLAALMKSDEQFFIDVEGRRAIRLAFNRAGQRERDLLNSFPGRWLRLSFASHRLLNSEEFLHQFPGLFETSRIKPDSQAFCLSVIRMISTSARPAAPAQQILDGATDLITTPATASTTTHKRRRSSLEPRYKELPNQEGTLPNPFG